MAMPAIYLPFDDPEPIADHKPADERLEKIEREIKPLVKKIKGKYDRAVKLNEDELLEIALGEALIYWAEIERAKVFDLVKIRLNRFIKAVAYEQGIAIYTEHDIVEILRSLPRKHEVLIKSASFDEKVGRTQLQPDVFERYIVPFIDIEVALSRIKPDYAATLLAYFVLDKHVTEIASVLGVSHQGISKRIKQGIRALHKEINNPKD